MPTPSKKPKLKKNPTLNRQAKALFILHTPHFTGQYESKKVGDYLKYPKISKEFLFVSNSYRIFSLGLLSFCDQKYSVKLEIGDLPRDKKRCVCFDCDFEKLENLSTWLHINFLEIRVYNSSRYDEDDWEEKISAFLRVCNEIYPDVKIKIICYKEFKKTKIVLSLIEKLSERIFDFDYCSNVLMQTNVKLTLNSCRISDKINIEDLKLLMQKEHKIEKLEFPLCRIDESYRCWETPIPIQQHLNNFPTNFTLKHIKIEYEMILKSDKNFDVKELESFLEFFPNLSRFDLNIHIFYFGGGERGATSHDLEEEIKPDVLNALNFIHEFRLLLAQKRPSIELEISYDFTITNAEKYGFEAFEDWAKALPDHPELIGIEKIGPIFDTDPYPFVKFEEGEYYKIIDEYHAISLEWKHRNFKGEVYMSIEDYDGPEEEEEEMEEE